MNDSCSRLASNVRSRTSVLFLGGLLDRQRNLPGDFADVTQEQPRRDRVRGDIARRIKPACSHLGEDEFRLLVDEMTDRQLKGERRANRDWLVE
jgi:hypothetical protein